MINSSLPKYSLLLVLTFVTLSRIEAQYIIQACTWIKEETTIGESIMHVKANGTFINQATVNYKGVTHLINDGGFSNQALDCTATYPSSCTVSNNDPVNLHVFDASQSLTTFSGSLPIRMHSVALHRNMVLENEWQILGALNWESGLITTNRNQPNHHVHWLTNSIVGASAQRHVDGYAACAANGYMELPIGDGIRLKSVGLNGTCSTKYSAAYFSTDPSLAALPIGAPFDRNSKASNVCVVSSTEYWDVSGSAAIELTFHFDEYSALADVVSNLDLLVVVGWNGSMWINLGNTGVTGTLGGSGTIKSTSIIPDDYTVFTLASKSLPVIVCPSNMMINTSNDGLGDCMGTATWIHPDFPNDACLPAQLQMNVDGGALEVVLPGATRTQSLEVGVHTITYQYVDIGSNTAQCSFQITVLDDELPILNCQTDTTVNLNGQATLPLSLTLLGSVTDNCSLPTTTIFPNIITAAQLGQSIPVQVMASDQAGNIAVCNTVVRVNGLPAGWSTPPNGGPGLPSLTFNPASGVWNGSSTGFTAGSPYTNDSPMLASRTLCGNGTITVKVSGINGIPSFAGIAMRESAAPNAKKVQMMINGTSNFLRREVRYVTGGQAFPSDVMNPIFRSWLRIERLGSVFRGYTSANGVDWWFVMQVVVPMNSCIDIGLVLINMQPNFPGFVTFENVVVTGADAGPTISAPITYMDQEDESMLDAWVYPNPGTGLVNIDLSKYAGRPVDLAVYDNQGRFVLSRAIDNSSGATAIFDLSDKPSGVYTLRIFTPGFSEVTKRIIIR
jgi:hypothetical protein